MNDQRGTGSDYVSYDYKDISVRKDKISEYRDGYECFGWQLDENTPFEQGGNFVRMKLKRNRHIINKTELTRLQRNFEACMSAIDAMEASKGHTARIAATVVGLLGTACMAMSTFGAVCTPPMWVMCIVFAIPGFSGWLAALPMYRFALQKRTKKIDPYIEEKRDEIERVCANGSKLLYR